MTYDDADPAPASHRMVKLPPGAVAFKFNGAPGTAIGFDVIAGATGEGTGLSQSNSGWVAFRARDAFGNYSIYRTLLGHCGSADFNHDGDVGTDADIEAFFRVLGGGGC